MGTGAVNSQRQASLTTSALPVGPDIISAQYSDDTNFAASTWNSVSVTVNPATNFTITPTPLAKTAFRGVIAGFVLQL